MKNLVIEDYESIELDDNTNLESRQNIDDRIARTRIMARGSKDNKFLDTLRSNISSESNIFYRPKTKQIIGVFGDDFIEISENDISMAVEGLNEYLKKFIDSSRKIPCKSDDWFELLTYNYKINMLGQKNSYLENINYVIMELIKANQKLGPSNNAEFLKGFTRFAKSIESKFDKTSVVKHTNYSIKNGKYISFLTNKYISDFVQEGVVGYNIIKEMGLLDKTSDEEFTQLYINRQLLKMNELLKEVVSRGKASDELEAVGYMIENHKKNFFKVLTGNDAINVFFSQKIGNDKDRAALLKKISIEDIQSLEPDILSLFLTMNFPTREANFLTRYPQLGKSVYLRKELMEGLDRKQLMQILLSRNINYKSPLTSEDLIDLYDGDLDSNSEEYEKTKKLTFLDIRTLYANGYINPEDIIKLNKFKNTISSDFKRTDHWFSISDFYDVKQLISMQENGQIHGRFVENFNNFLNQPEYAYEKEYYISCLKKELEELDNKDEVYINLLKTGLEINAVGQISDQNIANLYLEGRCTEADIIQLYQKGVVSLKAIGDLLLDNQIIEKVTSGELDYHALNFIKERTLNIGILLEEGKIDLSQLVGLFSVEDGLNIEDLKEISEVVSFGESSIAEMLPDDISFEKVEQLAKNWLISHNDLDNLVERKILTREIADKLADEIASHENYIKFFGDNSGIIQLVNQTVPGEANPPIHNRVHTAREDMIKNSPILQENLFEMLNFDNQGNIVFRGRNNSLDGYRIYSSENLGVVVFMKNTKPGNASYVMSVPQAIFTMQKIEREDKILEEKSKSGEEFARSDATKYGIRTTKHIKIINASKNWGRNMIEAMRQVSEKAREKIGVNAKYTKNIEGLLEEIREDYNRRKEDYESFLL